MVFSLEEEKEIQMLKQGHKLNLLQEQHKFAMLELEKQLQIEAVKSYQYGLDIEVKDKFLSIVFDKDGKLK